MAPFFAFFHALSSELNFFFDRRFPLTRNSLDRLWKNSRDKKIVNGCSNLSRI